MKNMIIGFLLCLTLGLTAGVVQNWGYSFSSRHTAAIALVTLDQVNLIRSKLSPPLPAISTNTMMQAMTDKYTGLADEFYDLEHPSGPQ